METLVVCYQNEPVPQHHIDRMAVVWPEVNIVNVGQADIAEALLDADYFCGHAKVPVDWDEIVRRGRLRWIQSSAAGMDWCLVPSVIASDITITTASGVLADQVAEHTAALLLAWMRNLPTFWKERFDPEMEGYRCFLRRPTRDLSYATVGIIGFGGVGRRLAEVLTAFRCTILATDLFPTEKPDTVAELHGADRLDEILPRCDVVVLALPLNAETRGIFDAERMDRMKSGAILANMARGPLVDTGALLAALQSGRLGGAVADVTDPEPLPPEHPFWDAPNTILTPHVAGQFHRRFDTVTTLFCENSLRFRCGKSLINRLSAEGKRLGFPLRGETPLYIDWATGTSD